MITKIVFLLFCLVPCHAQQASFMTGEIAGVLKGDDGTTVTAGNVWLKRTAPSGSRMQRNEWLTTSDSLRGFRFERLPEGQYTLCAQAPGVWLNPCEWGLRPPIVSISRGQRSASVIIVLKKGVIVPVRVDDPGQWLSENERESAGAHLLLGVSNDRFVFHPAMISSQDSGGRSYGILIPFDAPAKLLVSSAFFRLSDAVGLPLRLGSTAIPVTVPAGQNPGLIRLTVTGGGR
jgi:hypothetical protein